MRPLPASIVRCKRFRNKKIIKKGTTATKQTAIEFRYDDALRFRLPAIVMPR
jgi:hypothetical protein